MAAKIQDGCQNGILWDISLCVAMVDALKSKLVSYKKVNPFIYLKCIVLIIFVNTKWPPKPKIAAKGCQYWS